MSKLNFGLVVVLFGLGLGGCTVRECDPDREDCAFEHDAGGDSDTDTDTDTGSETGSATETVTPTDTAACVSAEWDPAADDTCADDHRVHTCDADVLVDIDCADVCNAPQNPEDGRCGVLNAGGFGCLCSDVTCDPVSAEDSCVNVNEIERCVDGLSITERCSLRCALGLDPGGNDGTCDGSTVPATCTCF